MLLTRLPIHRHVAVARIVWAFPVVGACVGAVGGAVYVGCTWLGMPSLVSAVWTLAAMLLITGALHEDGLADTADGFGGGRSRERKLEIMRDSRIGGFGACALVLSLAVRIAAIASLGAPLRAAAALIAAAAASRAAMLVPLVLLQPARTDGVAAELRTLDVSRVAMGCAVAVLVVAPLPLDMVLRCLAGAVIGALGVTWIAHRQIGGYTGDVLGATSVVAESLALSLISR